MKLSLPVYALLALSCVGSMFFELPGQTRRKPATTKVPTSTQPQPSPSATPTPEPRTRKATVKLKDGRSMDANFISASADKLELTIAGNHVTVGMDEVAAIILSPELAPAPTPTPTTLAPTPTPDNSAARAAIKALRKLDSVVSAGCTFREYGTRVADAKIAVDEAMPDIPDGELKTNIKKAMEKYVDTLESWSEDIRFNLKYSADQSLQSQQAKSLQARWNVARLYLEFAGSLLGK